MMNFLRRTLYLAARAYWVIARPLTLGVRVIMLRGDEVLLVKHTYQPHWYVPGGLVERGETLEQAARREAQEEIGARLGPLALLGVFSGYAEGKSDHITVFVCDQFTLSPVTNSEIERFAFFKRTGLPPDISPGTRRRIEMIAGEVHAPTYGPW
jgi:8-oxo-dGTP pyrophosphatase MutT (NUDIX family)